MVGAVARGPALATEELSITVGGNPVGVQEVEVNDGGRLHICTAVPGRLQLSYDAEVSGSAAPAKVDPVDDILYRRPSRYAESDELGPTAWAEFSKLDGKPLLDAVSSWVGTQLLLRERVQPPDRRRHPDPAAAPGGVPRLRPPRDRDAARAQRAGPAGGRLPSGLSPMDFHAVIEAAIDGQWRAVDATTLAPRETLVRISTGRDASDTAFLTVQSGRADLVSVAVTATSSPDLPKDQSTDLVSLT